MKLSANARRRIRWAERILLSMAFGAAVGMSVRTMAVAVIRLAEAEPFLDAGEHERPQ